MSYAAGDIVKFEGNDEPCIVYRVIDPVECMIIHGAALVPMPHIRIEVMGMVPVSYLRPASEHPRNMFALDKALHMNQQTN